MPKTLPTYATLDEYPVADKNDLNRWVEAVLPEGPGELITGNGPGNYPVRVPPGPGGMVLAMRPAADGLTWVAAAGQPINIQSAPYNCVGDGLTDNTTGMRQAFADADANNLPVIIPPGTYLTDTIDYRMQSFFGTQMNLCCIQGVPGKDVFTVNATLGQFYRQGGTIHDVTITVDDSVDAAASFPNRNGVGNAGYANDYNDKAAATPPSAINWQYYNVQITSTSLTVGGRNNSAGIYTQSNHFSQCRFNGLCISYLKWGWKDHYPNLNFTPYVTSFSRDHPQVNFLHFLRCGYQWTTYGWGIGEVSNVMFHGGPSIVDLDSDWNYMHVAGVEMVGNAPTLNWLQSTRSYKNEYSAFTHSTNSKMQWNEDESIFRGNINVPATAFPWLQVNGNYNTFALTSVDPAMANYGFDFVDDRGLGNQFSGGRTPSSTNIHRRQAMTPDGNRLARKRDSHAVFRGVTDPMFLSGDDLFINPRDLRQSSGLGTSYDYVYDSTTDFRVYFRRNATSVTFDNNHVNGIDGFKVGPFIHPGKYRVYVKCRAATAGTCTWIVQAPSGTDVGRITSPPIAGSPNWGVVAFEIDLSAVAVGTTLRLAGGTLAGGATQPIDIAWVAFRPHAVDWPVVRDGVSGDNGDASKTLVPADLETQRWIAPLTAARAVTLPTTAGLVYNGLRFHIVRSAASTGAFTLNIGTGPLKALATGQWCDVKYDGAAWYLDAFGAL